MQSVSQLIHVTNTIKLLTVAKVHEAFEQPKATGKGLQTENVQ